MPLVQYLTINEGFNSRTRVGATSFAEAVHKHRAVSIHAPVWVRLQVTSGDLTASWVSIHAPVWVRRPLRALSGKEFQFQFTHPCGCDRSRPARAYGPVGFNSRTRVGATLGRYHSARTLLVSIHAPVWVRRPDEYGLSIKHATKVLRQPDARTGCGQA